MHDAVFMEDVLATGPGLSAIAPAAFAAVVAATRFAVSTLKPAHASSSPRAACDQS
jgi:hypothetical protein